MKIKKIIAGICAAAISVSALAATVGAGTKDFYRNVDGTPLNGKLSLSQRQVVATASIGDNPENYDIAQARIALLTYTYKSNKGDGIALNGTASTGWGLGGAGCSRIIPEGFVMISATSYIEFNINGITHGQYSLYTEL